MNESKLMKEKHERVGPHPERLPWAGLFALAMAGFICVLTETLPAGLLPQIEQGLGVSEALAGQLVTLYAVGSLLAAIPLTAMTQGWRRRHVLLSCIVSFLVFNTVTALSTSYALTLVARFFAGISAGVLWGIIAGYARRMVSESLKGRAMAVAMVGTPLALALGVPAGTLVGELVGWRAVFGIVSIVTVVLILWVLWKLPDFAGQSSSHRVSLRQVFIIPGVRPILFVVLTWVLAHNILYTYIAPYLAQSALAKRVDVVLLLFGITSVIGIWAVGLLIDRFLRKLVLISIAAFGCASIALGIGASQPMVILLGVAVWGLVYGGAATLLQTAMAQASGTNTDVAQSMLVTSWNVAIGGGGIIGGILLETFTVVSLPWAVAILLLFAFIIAWQARAYGFVRHESRARQPVQNCIENKRNLV